MPQIWLEYAKYGSLSNLEQITQTECIHITHQCSGALAYLHSKNTVHRDIKPENILVYFRDVTRIHVKLCDFGLSKQPLYGEPLQSYCGTPVYMAPEVVYEAPSLEDGHPGYGFAVDIWSLGVVILELDVGLPTSLKSDRDWMPGSTWCLAIHARISRLMRQRPNALNQLLAKMLLLSPQVRISAKRCYEECQILVKSPGIICRTWEKRAKQTTSTMQGKQSGPSFNYNFIRFIEAATRRQELRLAHSPGTDIVV